MQKTLKISLLDKTYTITTDEHEQCVVRAVDRITKLLENRPPTGGAVQSDHARAFVLPLLQLAIELEKALDSIEETALKKAALEKMLSTVTL